MDPDVGDSEFHLTSLRIDTLRNLGLPQAEMGQDLILNLVSDVRVALEEVSDVLLTLPQLLIVVAEPRTGLGDEAAVNAHVDKAALARNALSVEDVKLCLLKGWGDLVLDDLNTSAITNHLGPVLEGLDTTNI